MSEREITRLMDKSRDDAEWYTERITRYLQENHTLFPLFDNPPTAIDTIYPANSSYQTGMVLGGGGAIVIRLTTRKTDATTFNGSQQKHKQIKAVL